jgi:hypothetical protein
MCVARHESDGALQQRALRHLRRRQTFVGLAEQPHLTTCLLLYTLRVVTLFDRCCTRPELYTTHARQCEFLFDDASSAATPTRPALQAPPLDAAQLRQLGNLRSDAVLTALVVVNREDCVLYQAATDEFYNRVREMERVTRVTFLAVPPPAEASALCAEGLRRASAFMTGTNVTGRPRQCPSDVRRTLAARMQTRSHDGAQTLARHARWTPPPRAPALPPLFQAPGESAERALQMEARRQRAPPVDERLLQFLVGRGE